MASLWRPRQESSRKPRTGRANVQRRRCRPRLEPLEDRLAPAIVTVTTLSDAASHSGTSLRDAIAAAGPGDTIQFTAGLSGAIDLNTSQNGQGKLYLSKNLTIDGTGASITVEGGSAAGSASNAQPFTVSSGVTAVLNDLTISNGYTGTYGGGIYNSGTLTISNSTLANNFANSNGGGIYNNGTLTVSNTTLLSNSATYYGGGIDNWNTLTVTNSTLSENSDTGYGGGGIANHYNLTVSNSTFSHDSSSNDGGAIYNANSNSLSVSNCQFTFNQGVGGAIYNDAGSAANPAAISSSTFFGNSAPNTNGGAIFNYTHGMLTISDSMLGNNSATAGGGGGIYNLGTVTVNDSTLASNSSTGGGAIWSEGTLTVNNSTLWGNSATNQGGGILSTWTLTLTNDTLSNNSATSQGGGIYSSSTLNLTNTIVANSPSGQDLYFIGNLGTAPVNNLIQTENSNAIQNGVNGNIVGANPLLSALDYYGGTTPTLALLPGSPALDAGSNGAAAAAGLGTDQRGYARVINGTVDIGAFESHGFTLGVGGGSGQSTPVNTTFAGPLTVAVGNSYGEPVAGGQVSFAAPASGASASLAGTPATIDASGQASVSATANGTMGQNYSVTASTAGANTVGFALSNTETPGLVVTTLADVANPFDGQTSLREAINYANTLGGSETITFNRSLFNTSQTMTLNGTQLPTITDPNLRIAGPGAYTLTIDAHHASGIFQIGAGVTASLFGLTLTNGLAMKGGAIYNSGTLSVIYCTLWANTALNAAGGGIYSAGPLTLIGTTLVGNSAGAGAAIFSDTTTLTILNSTLADNASTGFGGGLEVFSGSATLTNSTVSGNTVTISGNGGGGGLAAVGTTVTLDNTILAGNTVNGTENDIVNLSASETGDYDLTGDATAPGSHSITDANPLLSPLGYYDSLLPPTFALLPGSPALDAGSNSAAAAAGLGIDQRDFPRVLNGTVDIGAFESHGFVLSVSGGSGQSVPAGAAFANPLTVTVYSAYYGEPVAGGQVTFTAPAAGASADLAGTPATIGANGQASVTATANGIMGAYSVTASAAGAGSVAFSLGNAEAPSLVVTTLADAANPYDGQTSLREAIAYANTLPGATTITFQPRLTGTITLTGGALPLTNTHGTMTIQGPGANLLTIDGNNASEVFQVNSGVSAVLDGLTIAHGFGYYGGGIITSGTLTVSNSSLSGNSATSYGGAIYNSGTLTVSNSSLSDNSAQFGGALYNYGANYSGTLTVNNSTLASNSASGSGGAIYNYGTTYYTGYTIYYGPLTVSGSTLVNNSASYGGAIYNYLGPLTVNNSTLANDTASGGGGGIYTYAAPLSVSNSTFANNSSGGNSGVGGGALWNDRGTLTLGSSTFSGNSAQYGGGLLNYGTATVSNSAFLGDSASVYGFGGGIYNSGTLTVSDSTFSGNSTYGSGYGGGGIFSNYVLTVNSSTFSGNSDSGTVGAAIFNYGWLSLANTILANSVLNSSQNSVADLYNGSAPASFQNNLIQSEYGNVPSNDVNGNIIGANPLLSALGYYGGPTQTFALLPGSPALDAGSNSAASGVSTDQRGQPRITDGTIDIGAFESRGFTFNVSGGGQSTPINAAFANPLAVTVASIDGTPLAGGTVAFAAPTSGASANLSAARITLPANGQASVSATADGIVGSYLVTISAGGGWGTTAALANTNKAPVILTQTPGGALVLGGKLTDAATLSSGVNETGTITFTLYSPSGAVVDTETAAVNGNGTYSTPTGFTSIAVGTYQWAVRYSGDSSNNPAVPSLGLSPTSTLRGLVDIYDVAIDASGNRYVAESEGQAVAVFAPGSTTPTSFLTGVSLPTWLGFDPSGNLFVVSAFQSAAWEFAPGATTPTATLTGLNSPQGLPVFDAHDDLFISNAGNNTISEYAPGATSPTATLTGLSGPGFLAFDSFGNLFVSNGGNNTVGEFAPGSTTPTATLTGLNGPQGLAFDAHGNLFVSNGGNNTVSEFAPGSTTPTATLTGLSGPTDLALDGSGNLFVLNRNTINEFAPGSTTPTATLTGLNQTIHMAFDGQGDLYAVSYGSATVSEFTPVTSAETVYPTPVTQVGALPTREPADTFTVPTTFGSAAGTLAAGISSVDLYASTNGGAFALVQTLSTDPTAVSGTVNFSFTGADRNTYDFHSIAHSVTGAIENKSSTLTEASTYVPDLNPPVTHAIGASPTYSWGPFFPAAIFSGVSASFYANGVFTLSWAGADPDQPAGGTITSLSIYEQIDSNAPTLVGTVTPGSPTVVDGYNVYSGSMTVGALGDGQAHNYSFYSIGTDDQKQQQAVPASADVAFSNITYTAPLAASLSVEKGIAERSYIRYLDVSFNQTLPSSPALQALQSGLGGTSPTAYVELLWYGENLTSSSTAPGSVNLFSGSTATLNLSGAVLSIDFGAGGITSLLTEANVAGTGSPRTTFGDGWYALGIDPYGDPTQHATLWLPFFRLLGDVNGDGVVTGPSTSAGTDANIVSLARGQSGPLLNADVNGDGAVNTTDLQEVSAAANAHDAVGATAPSNFPSFQLLAGPAGSGAVPALTTAQLDALVPQAIAAWQAAGLSALGRQAMQQVRVQVADLGTSILGEEYPGLIEINRTAAGHAWSLKGRPAANQVDLRTVLEHELGHVAGLPDNAQPGDLMDTTLAPGVRRAPSAADARQAAFALLAQAPPSHSVMAGTKALSMGPESHAAASYALDDLFGADALVAGLNDPLGRRRGSRP